MRTIFFVSAIFIISLMLITPGCSFQTKARKERTPAPASIHGKVAVIMKSGDVKPIAKSWFMLLPFSVGELRGQYKPGLSEANEEQFLDAIEAQYLPAESSGRAFKFQTDFDGSYEVKGIPPGRYCISDDSYRLGPRNWCHRLRQSTHRE